MAATRINVETAATNELPIGAADFADFRVEVYEKPINLADGPGYAVRRDYLPGQCVPVVLDGSQVGPIAVGEVFPA